MSLASAESEDPAEADREPELPRTAQRAVDRYLASLNDANDALAQAHAEHVEAITKARGGLIKALERSVSSRSSIPEQAAIYRLILTYDRGNAAARGFFESIGTLTQTLADLEAEVPTDFLGNPIDEPSQVGSNSLTGAVQATVLIACDNSYTLSLNGSEVAAGSNWSQHQSVNLTLRRGDILAVAAADGEMGDRTAGLMMIVLIDGTAALSGEQLHYAVNPPDNWATTADMRGFQPASRDNVHQIHRDSTLGEHQTHGVWSSEPARQVFFKHVF